MCLADPKGVTSPRNHLRPHLACVGFGAIAVVVCGIRLMAPGALAVPLTVGELVGVSLPLTVAWFAFSGSCILSREEDGLVGILAACSRFAGQAFFCAGIPVWAYWYLHLVFGVL